MVNRSSKNFNFGVNYNFNAKTVTINTKYYFKITLLCHLIIKTLSYGRKHICNLFQWFQIVYDLSYLQLWMEVYALQLKVTSNCWPSPLDDSKILSPNKWHYVLLPMGTFKHLKKMIKFVRACVVIVKPQQSIFMNTCSYIHSSYICIYRGCKWCVCFILHNWMHFLLLFSVPQ